MTDNPLKPSQSDVKRALDHAEFVERVPELQREAAQDGGYTASGGTWLKLPRHPLVIAYVNECKRTTRPTTDSLAQARRLLRAATVNYEKLCCWRLPRDIEWPDGGRWLALSAVIEARAEAMHWRRIVAELETVARVKAENARTIQRAQDRAAGIVRYPRRRQQTIVSV